MPRSTTRNTSYGSHGTAFRRLDAEAVLANLREWASTELARRTEVIRAVLIGSLAHGTWSAGSDADVVIVVDGAPGAFTARDASYRPTASLGIGLDLFVRTPAELDAMGARFAAEVAAGTVLFERPLADPPAPLSSAMGG